MCSNNKICCYNGKDTLIVYDLEIQPEENKSESMAKIGPVLKKANEYEFICKINQSELKDIRFKEAIYFEKSVVSIVKRKKDKRNSYSCIILYDNSYTTVIPFTELKIHKIMPISTGTGFMIFKEEVREESRYLCIQAVGGENKIVTYEHKIPYNGKIKGIFQTEKYDATKKVAIGSFKIYIDSYYIIMHIKNTKNPKYESYMDMLDSKLFSKLAQLVLKKNKFIHFELSNCYQLYEALNQYFIKYQFQFMKFLENENTDNNELGQYEVDWQGLRTVLLAYYDRLKEHAYLINAEKGKDMASEKEMKEIRTLLIAVENLYYSCGVLQGCIFIQAVEEKYHKNVERKVATEELVLNKFNGKEQLMIKSLCQHCLLDSKPIEYPPTFKMIKAYLMKPNNYEIIGMIASYYNKDLCFVDNTKFQAGTIRHIRAYMKEITNAFWYMDNFYYLENIDSSSDTNYVNPVSEGKMICAQKVCELMNKFPFSCDIDRIILKYIFDSKNELAYSNYMGKFLTRNLQRSDIETIVDIYSQSKKPLSTLFLFFRGTDTFYQLLEYAIQSSIKKDECIMGQEAMKEQLNLALLDSIPLQRSDIATINKMSIPEETKKGLIKYIYAINGKSKQSNDSLLDDDEYPMEEIKSLNISIGSNDTKEFKSIVQSERNTEYVK